MTSSHPTFKEWLEAGGPFLSDGFPEREQMTDTPAKLHLVRIGRKYDVYVATSSDLGGLLVVDKDPVALEAEVSKAIVDLYEAAGEAVVALRADRGLDSSAQLKHWVVIPRDELLQRAFRAGQENMFRMGPEDFAKFQRELDDPKPPNQELIKLMRSKPPWGKSE